MLRKRMSAVIAVAVAITIFSAIPVCAQETEPSVTASETVVTETVPLTEETTEVTEETAETSGEETSEVTEGTTETSGEETSEVTAGQTGFSTYPESAELRGDGLILDEISEDSDSYHRIYSASDVVTAFGAQNAIAISSTDVKLINNILLKDGSYHYFDFLDGTIRIDFNGFYVEGIVDFIVNGGDIVFLDSSSAGTGGIRSTPVIESDGASGFPAIFQRGGNVTIQSGRYMSDFYAFSGQAGRLNISGGDFYGTGVSEYSNSFGIELEDGVDATISGGYFHGEGAGLYARKDVSEENPLRLVISGGLFTSKLSGTYNAGIVITWTGSAVAPNLPGMIATNSVLSPATVYSGKSSTWFYAQTEQNVCVVRTANGTLIGGGVEGFVTRLYEQALQRGADPTGFSNWITQLKSYNMNGAQVAYGFFFSQELINQGLSDQDYLNLLYRVFFDRAADGGGLSYWLSNLNSGVSRKFVFAGFANSQEWKSLCGRYGIDPGGYTSDEPRDQNLQVTAFVQRLYSLCLGRSGDATGINNWTGTLINKTGDGAHVAYGFFFSQEMINRGLTNEAYVEVLYQVLLGRTSDAAGKSNWTAQLNSGTSRLSVFRGFVLSQEFDAICLSYGITRGSV